LELILLDKVKAIVIFTICGFIAGICSSTAMMTITDTPLLAGLVQVVIQLLVMFTGFIPLFTWDNL